MSVIKQALTCPTTWKLQVKELEQQLQQEIELRLALESAVEHSDSTCSTSTCQLPHKVSVSRLGLSLVVKFYLFIYLVLKLLSDLGARSFG